jgi:NDP-sugar pyrophosphorylase family protein
MTQEIMPKKAMLLAAGKGTRLQPYTDSMHKCMIPIDGKPLLEHTINKLQNWGVTDLLINLFYLPDSIKNYFGDGKNWGVNITYSLEKDLLGTAGGVKNVEGFFDGSFFLLYGDNLSTCSLAKLWQTHQKSKAKITIALYWREDPWQSGIVEITPEGKIVRFLEKPKPEEVFSHWVNAGILVVEKEVLELIPKGTFADFGHDIFPALLKEGSSLAGYTMSKEENLWWIDTPKDLERVTREYRKEL